MQDISIHRLKTHYRLPAKALSAGPRLDRLRETVIEQAVARAAVDLGLPEDAELCIRQLCVPISLSLSASDGSLAQDWGVAIAQEIALTARESSTENVVFYHSRRQALTDLALGIARGDMSRIWAWRQLGLWRSGDLTNGPALVELTRSLCVQGAVVIPVLRVIADAGLLPSLASQLTDEQWEKLARAALSEAGVERLAGESLRVPSPRAERGVLRVLHTSSLVRAIAVSALSRVIGEKTWRAVAALAVLEVEPVLLHSETAEMIVALVADAIQTRAGRATLPGSSGPGAAASIAPSQGSEVINLSGAAVESEDTTNAPLDLRQRGFTRFGGLLFLLHIIDELRLPERILEHKHLGVRPFVWVVHQLALTLVNIEAHDPAAMAFAGLPPNGVAPSQGEEPARKDETAALTELAAGITNRLRTMLESDGQTDIELLEFMCARPAEIVADPGWIEARFSLDDVSTMIRRSGLDVDPDYVPWLGVVLKFVYE